MEDELYGTSGCLVKKLPGIALSPRARSKGADRAKLIKLVVRLHTLIRHKLTVRKSQFYLDIREKFLTIKTKSGNCFHRHFY